MIFGKARQAPSDEEVAELRQQLRRARQRVRRKQEALDKAKDQLGRVKPELALLRSFTLDVFPEIEIPDRARDVSAAVREEHLTYLSPEQLRSLVSCVVETEQQQRPGVIVEAGTALGGSAIAMAAAKDPARPMVVYDAFGMIPPPSEKDTDRERARYDEIVAGNSSGVAGEVYYGYREDLLGEVTASFARHGVPVEESGVRLVEGLFEDTIDLDEPVALAHLDGDWYESTMTCLTRLAPLIVPGGRIVFDDYHFWNGCRMAVEEYFADRDDFRLEYRARVHAVRVP